MNWISKGGKTNFSTEGCEEMIAVLLMIRIVKTSKSGSFSRCPVGQLDWWRRLFLPPVAAPMLICSKWLVLFVYKYIYKRARVWKSKSELTQTPKPMSVNAPPTLENLNGQLIRDNFS